MPHQYFTDRKRKHKTDFFLLREISGTLVDSSNLKHKRTGDLLLYDFDLINYHPPPQHPPPHQWRKKTPWKLPLLLLLLLLRRQLQLLLRRRPRRLVRPLLLLPHYDYYFFVDVVSVRRWPFRFSARSMPHTAVQGLRFSCYSWAPEPRHPVHVTDVYATESRTPLVLELSADRFSVGLLLHCCPPSRVRAGEWAKVCGGQAPLWSAASAEKQRIFFLFRLQPTRHRYSLAHSTAHMSSGQSTK